MANKNDYLYELNFINGLTQQEPNKTDYDFLTEHSYYSSNWMYVPTDTLISLGGVSKGCNNYNNNNFVENPYGSQTYVFDGVLRVDIDSINKTVSYTGANVAPIPITNAQHPDWGYYSAFLINTVDVNGNFSCQNFMGQDSTPALSYTSFTDFDDAILHLQRFFKHINIWVDGELWSSAEVTYNWQSVPSISGKNGILLLSTIQSVYLNDGEPVNDALESYINFIDASKVAVLVEQEIDDLTKVTVKYVVPAGTYEYIKLVYKVGSAPTSITDGTAIDILQTNRSVTISGIANGNTYFFKIFTDVSESEPYEFTTTKPPIASNYVFELDLSTDGKDIVRYDATKDIGNHKQGELYGSGISIEDGILTTSSWIYWDYDGTENPKFIPANCTLTFEYDAFFPNGEGYLDWYVIDSNGNERIYWCFDTQHAFQSNKWYNCKTVAKVQNGKIVRYKYVLDGNEISSNTADINMPCVNTETSLGISEIYFRLTRTTKFKNMAIYFDFSEYHDGGGSGSGSSGRA